MMCVKVIILLFMVILQGAIGPPVTQSKKGADENQNEGNEASDTEQLGNLGIEYNRYLKEVVTALESDPEFREKLEKAEEVDIRTGKIANELEYVNHQVRSKLDEIKRSELERLRHLARKEYELKNGIDTEHLKIAPEHLDHSNPHTFEIEDLRKLIAKTTADLAEADKQRREEFKEYEMQKEFEKQEKLRNLDEEHKKKLEEELKEKEKKHKAHEPLHHPGSKQQLEEVWEKQDHMENQEFDPKTFFYLHDLDGNGVWDESEVKALFLKELDKLYKAGAPEDDMRERVEEMERMREHVFSEADTNHDGLISYQEFLAQTQKPDFEKDQGWEGLDQQQLYTQEEYREFERRRQEEVQRLIQQGMIPPSPPGYHPGMPAQQFQQPQHFAGQQQYYPQGQVHPNQIPQGQVPQGQFHPGQVQQGQYHPGQVQQGQYHPGQVHQGQFHPGQLQPGHSGQVPQGQFHPGQVQPGRVHPGQVQPGQVHPGQVQPGQVHPGQVQPGQVHPGQVQPGQVHTGQGQQGQVHIGQGQQGQVQTGQVQQGQVHPGQVQQGQASPGQVQLGKVHPGQVQPGQVQQSQTGQVKQGSSDPQLEQAQSIVQQHVPVGHHPIQPIEHKNEAIDLNQFDPKANEIPGPEVGKQVL